VATVVNCILMIGVWIELNVATGVLYIVVILLECCSVANVL
jgi:hypothetical protein